VNRLGRRSPKTLGREVQAGEAPVRGQAVRERGAVGVGEGVEKGAQAEGRARRGRGEEGGEVGDHGRAKGAGAEGEGVEGGQGSGAVSDAVGELLAQEDAPGLGEEVSVEVEESEQG
jgi:hypothetical protein